MIYLTHRAFLPSIDELHKDTQNFPSPTQKALSPKTMEFINQANGEIAAATTAVETKSIQQRTGCKGPYSLARLPYHDRYLNTPVEPMHLIKNIAEHTVKLISGIEDSIKVRKEEQQRKRFKGSWVKSGDNSSILPPAPFLLSKEEMAVANNRALSVKVPSGVDWKRRKLFDRKSIGYLKSVEWKHVLCSGILKYCIRDILGEEQRKTLYELCDVVSELLDYNVDDDAIDSIEYRVHRVLSLLERNFPVSLHVIVFHLLHHLPIFIRRFGPANGFWMYPMERFNSWIASRITNRRHPENTVLETYRLFELTFFMQLSGIIPQDVASDLTDTISEHSQGDNESHVHLNGEQLFHLNSYYSTLYCEHNTVVSEVTPNQLAPSQVRVHVSPRPTDYVASVPVYVKQDKYGRKVKYSTTRADDPSSSFASSYVALKTSSTGGSPSEQLFGQIQMIFKHKFNQRQHILAYVHWFDQSERDRESGLHTVTLDSSCNACKVASIFDLSRPVVHALDCHEQNKLWLLNSNCK